MHAKTGIFWPKLNLNSQKRVVMFLLCVFWNCIALRIDRMQQAMHCHALLLQELPGEFGELPFLPWRCNPKKK